VQTGESAAAAVAFGQAVEDDPEHGRALYRLAVLEEEDGRVREAIDRYSRAIHVQPRLSPAYAGLGSLYARYGRPREAVGVFRNCIQNENPRDDETRAARAQCRAELGRILFEQAEIDEAVRFLSEAAALRPESPSVQFNLGLALRARYAEGERAEDRDRALVHLQRAASQCNPTAERARCESIQAALQELRTPRAN
jgi:tetratricopeptide (TPR) repeat protein